MTETRISPTSPTAVDRVRGLEAVLFDLDGTLIDTIPLILDSFRYATSTVLGAPVSDEVLARNVGIPLIVQMREFTDDDEVAVRLLDAYREHNRANHDERARLFEGTAEVLSALAARGMPMGVVTSKSREIATRGIELFGLERHFGAVVTMDDVERYKPEPDPLWRAAALLGVEPGKTAYVGDSPHDIEAALRAGSVAIAASWGVSSRERLLEARPHFLLDDVTDLPELLFGDPGRFIVDSPAA